MFKDRKIVPNTTIIDYIDGKAIYIDENKAGKFYDEIPAEMVEIGGIMLDPSYTPYEEV